MASPLDTIEQYASGFDALYGLEMLDYEGEHVTARVKVRPEVCQPYGLVHGGVYASIAEALASIGTGLAVFETGKTAVGLSNATSFLRPITEGHINATAVPVHRGRSTWVWDVECADDHGRRCAMTRMTIAVRDAR
jgi:uncharacterized protein (TIGR00369 family)